MIPVCQTIWRPTLKLYIESPLRCSYPSVSHGEMRRSVEWVIFRVARGPDYCTALRDALRPAGIAILAILAVSAIPHTQAEKTEYDQRNADGVHQDRADAHKDLAAVQIQ